MYVRSDSSLHSNGVSAASDGKPNSGQLLSTSLVVVAISGAVGVLAVRHRTVMIYAKQPPTVFLSRIDLATS